MPAQTSDTSFFTYKTPLGDVTIASSLKGVAFVGFGTRYNASSEGVHRPTDITNECATQILEYLSGKRYVFDVPLYFHGTDFQRRVWNAVRSVPYGQTRTSAEIAALINEPTSYRLVGGALKENPLEILIPTHRVVSSHNRKTALDLRSKRYEALREIEQKYS